MKSKLLCQSMLALGVAAATNAGAQTLTDLNPNRVISWNYDSNGTVQPTDIVGLAPAVNWINSWPNNQVTDLPDNFGNVTGLGIAAYQSSGQYGASVINHHPGYDSDGTANRELLNGYMNAGPASWGPPFTNSMFTLTNIPFAVYDIVVYFSSDASGRHTAIDDGITTNYASTVGSPSVNGASALFIPATSTNPTVFPSANFAFFPRHTGSALTVNELPKSGNDQWLGIAGWQIIESSNVYALYGPYPAVQTVPIGGTATFTVMVGGENPRVQWRHGGAPILDATNTTYTIPSTAVGQDGSYDVVITNSFSSMTSSVASLVFYTPKTLRWAGLGGTWDTSSAFWTTTFSSPFIAYTETDNVRFDTYGVAQNYVTLGGTFTPSSVTVSNATYTLTSGSIGGSGSLNVVNNGNLTLDATDTSTGPVNVSNGSTLQIGNGGATGSLGSGALTNNGALIFNQSDDYAYGYPVYGTGSITNLGGPGRITLGSDIHANYLNMAGSGSLLIQGNNSFTGGLIVDNGTVLIRSGGGLGAAPVRVNSGTLQLFFNFDFIGSSITLAGGLLDIEGGITTFEGPINLAIDSTIQTGSQLIVTNGNINGGAFNLLLSGSGSLVLAGAPNSWASLTIGNSAVVFNAATDQTLSTPISGSGNLEQHGPGALTLAGDNSGMFGNLIVSGGTLLVNTASSATTTLATNTGTLGGNGSLTGPVAIDTGATLAPGTASIGTLTLSSDLTIGGNVLVKVNKSLVQSNDFVSVAGTLSNTNNGTVTVNNLGGALQVGDTFKLFSQAVIGGETLAVTGAGVVWTNKLATDGTIQVLATVVPKPVISSVGVVGGNLIFSGTNGTPNGAFTVLSSTNLALPLSSWTTEATGNFNGSGAFSVTNPVSSTVPQKFYLLKL